MPWTSVKRQVLTDFIVEFAESAVIGMLVLLAIVAPSWKVYTDGASNRKGAGVGVVLITPEKLIMEKSLRLGFSTTNNEVEYEALLAGINMVRLLGGETVKLYSDSRLIVGQVNGALKLEMKGCRGTLLKCRVPELISWVLF